MPESPESFRFHLRYVWQKQSIYMRYYDITIFVLVSNDDVACIFHWMLHTRKKLSYCKAGVMPHSREKPRPLHNSLAFKNTEVGHKHLLSQD